MGYRLVKTDAFARDLDAAIRYIALSLQNVTVTGQQGHNIRPAKDTMDGHMLS